MITQEEKEQIIDSLMGNEKTSKICRKVFDAPVANHYKQVEKIRKKTSPQFRRKKILREALKEVLKPIKSCSFCSKIHQELLKVFCRAMDEPNLVEDGAYYEILFSKIHGGNKHTGGWEQELKNKSKEEQEKHLDHQTPLLLLISNQIPPEVLEIIQEKYEKLEKKPNRQVKNLNRGKRNEQVRREHDTDPIYNNEEFTTNEF